MADQNMDLLTTPPSIKNYVLTDISSSHTFDWPLLTVQWLPGETAPEGGEYVVHRAILGTITSQPLNYLLIVRLKLAKSCAQIFTFENTIEIEKKINHEGEVLRARYMPHNACIIATKATSGEVLIFDITKHPSRPGLTGECRPELRLRGHSLDGFGLAWNPNLTGHLLSGADDNTICLWDINAAPQRNRTMAAKNIFTGHSARVGGVAWHAVNQSIFGSAGGDRQLMIWDTRSNTCKPSHVVNAHTAGIHDLSFNPHFENLLATGSGDGTVAIWDMRNLSEKLNNIVRPQGAVYLVDWSPNNGNVLASSGTDNRLYAWNLTKIVEAHNNGGALDAPPELMYKHSCHMQMLTDFSWNRNKPWMLASVAQDNILYYSQQFTVTQEDD